MIDLGLGRITRLVRGHAGTLPWKAIHIAGTNGKGSVAAYLSAIFHRKGVRVGRFTSPHLVDRWDCITLNQVPVARHKFLEVESEVKRRDRDGNINATEFELLTATAFEIFSRERVQIGIIECGMGGLRDATNVLEKEEVLCSVITKIGLDHQDWLGSTIEDIAKEKAGIIKPGVPVVVDGSSLPSAVSCLREQAKLTGSPYEGVDRATAANYVQHLSIPAHQKDNLSLALTSTRLAASRMEPGLGQSDLTSEDTEEIVKEVQREWKGRLQWLSVHAIAQPKSRVLLDGAHNAQSAEVLGEYVGTHRTSNVPVTWILAMSAGKDIDGILSLLLRPGDKVIACHFGPVDGMPWVKAQDPAVLADRASTFQTTASCAVSVRQAIEDAVRVTDASSLIVIAGSLYLVSDVLRLLRDAEKPG